MKKNSGGAKGFGGAQDRAQVAGVLQASGHDERAVARAIEQLSGRESRQLEQRRHALGRVAGHDRVEECIRQDERFGAGVDLGQKFFGERARRFAEEHALQMQAAAQCFFEQFDAFDGALAVRGQFGAAECQPQFLQPLVVAAGDGPQTVRLHCEFARACARASRSCFIDWFQEQDVWYISLFKPTMLKPIMLYGRFTPAIRKEPECARKS